MNHTLLLSLLLTTMMLSACTTVKTWDGEGNLVGKCRAVNFLSWRGECVGHADGRVGR